MDGYRRYAVYWAPEQGSALARFGASWLGWDAEAGVPLAHPQVEGLPAPAAELTAQPRRYGFHGTLKAPIRLAAGTTPGGFAEAVERLAAGWRDFEMPPLVLRALGPFLALVPAEPSPALDAIAAACVTELDRFRAPMDEAERARRSVGLTPAQAALLDRWGYPYVLEAFGFHLTLTGPLPDEVRNGTAAALAPLLGPVLAERRRFGALSIFGEPEAGPFRLLRRCRLQG